MTGFNLTGKKKRILLSVCSISNIHKEIVLYLQLDILDLGYVSSYIIRTAFIIKVMNKMNKVRALFRVRILRNNKNHYSFQS